MWPFSRKKKEAKLAKYRTVSEALEQLGVLGIRMRPGISNDDLLLSLEGTMESPGDWVGLLCTLGSQVERKPYANISDNIWHFDAECIDDDGSYVALVKRFVDLSQGALPLTEICDHVDIQEGEAWMEFVLEGTRHHWDLGVTDDWVDPGFYSRMQELVTPRAAGKKFFIVALGQDSLVSFGDDQLRQALSALIGLEFQWE